MQSLFLFAHPDDEFGCYESIRIDIELGKDVLCVFMTDGGYDGQSPERRNLESTKVLSLLGVKTSNIIYLGLFSGIQDGLLPYKLFDASAALLNALSGYENIDKIYVPAWEGGHQDHDAVHIIGVELNEIFFEAKNGLWQYSIYHGEGLKGPFFHVLKPLRNNGPCVIQKMPFLRRMGYLRLCLKYPSQWKTWMGLYPFVAYRLIFDGCYRLQLVRGIDYSRRPHAGRLLYERRGAFSYENFFVLLSKYVEMAGKELSGK